MNTNNYVARADELPGAEAEKRGVELSAHKPSGERSLPPADMQTRAMTEEEIDEILEGSFPASDPPSWTLGVEVSQLNATRAG